MVGYLKAGFGSIVTALACSLPVFAAADAPSSADVNKLATATANLASAASSLAASSVHYQSVVKPFAEDVSGIFSILTTILLSVAVVVAFWILRREWRREPMVIEPLDVPDGLRDEGLTGAVLAQRLADRIVELQHRAHPDDGPEDAAFVELSRMQVDLQLPGVAWSLRNSIRYFRQVFGKDQHRVGGEVVRIGKDFVIRIRTSGGHAVDVPTPFHDASDLPQALVTAAESVLLLVNPLEAATIHYSLEGARSGYPKTLVAIRRHLAVAPAREHQDSYVLWASVQRAAGNAAGMDEMLRLAAMAPVSRRSGRASGKPGTRYLNFMGSLCREQRRYDEAQRFFLEAWHLNDRNVSALSNLGLLNLDRGHHEEAERWFRRLIRVKDRSSRGYRGLGLVAMSRSALPEAMRYLSRAIDVAPRARWPRVNRVETHRLAGRMEAAERELQELLRIDADFAPLFRFWSVIARGQENLPLARKRAGQAAELDPLDAWNLVELARLAVQSGDSAEAFRLADRALEMRPDMPEAHRCRADAFSMTDRPDDAAAALREGAQRAPDDIWCLLELSDLHRRRGRYEEAARAAFDASARKPQSADPLRRLALAWSERRRHAEAERWLRQAVEIAPAEPWALIDLAMELSRQFRFDEAAAAATRAAALGIRPAQGHRRLAQVLEAQLRPAQAEAELRRALVAQPSSLWAQSDLVDLLRRTGRLREARETGAGVVRRWPESPYVGRAWASVLKAGGDVAGAESALRRAIAAAPRDIDTIVALVDQLLEDDRPDDAEAVVREALFRHADTARCLRCRARIRRAQDREAEAEADWTQALAVNEHAIDSRLELCRALRDWGRHEDAIATARDGLTGEPTDARLLRFVAEIYALLGEVREARDAFTAATRADPLDIDALLDFGDFLANQREVDETVELTGTAHLMDSFALRPWRCRALAHQRAGRFEQALADLETAAGMSPTAPDDLLRIARLFEQNDRLDEAAAALTRARERQPGSPDILRAALELDLKRADFDAAHLVEDALAAAAPQDIRGSVALAYACMDAGRLDDARTALDRAAVRRPDAHEVAWARGHVLSRAGDPAGAEREFRRAIELRPWAASHALDLADWLASTKRRTEAIQVLDEALGMRPGSASVLGKLASLLRADHQQASAEDMLRRCMAATRPTDPWGLMRLAGTLEEFGRDAEALSTAREAASLRPPRSSILGRAGELLARRGARDEAARMLRESGRMDPGAWWTWMALARLVEDVEPETARHACREALRVRPDLHEASRMLARLEGRPASTS
jgi:tetratricopeptide (TPR) repeat protein